MIGFNLQWLTDQAHWFLWATGTSMIAMGLWPRRPKGSADLTYRDLPEFEQPSLAMITPPSASAHGAESWETEEVSMRPPRKGPDAYFRDIQAALVKEVAPPLGAPYLAPGKAVLDGRTHDSLWPKAEPIYVIGDIHGDFFALAYLADQILQWEGKLNLLFLGDLVDRGPHSAECLVLLDQLARQGNVLWLAGNHDLALSCSPEQGSFRSRVEPAEYADELNQSDSPRIIQQWARHLITLAPSLPRAFLHSSGILFTHGGFPLEDLRAQRPDEPELLFPWLQSEKCLNDFTWTRMTRHPRKIPNRETLGSSYGHLDFDDFCTAVAPWADLRALVAGHQHCPEGFDAHPSWKKHPALTLTGFGFAEHVGYGRDYRPYLTTLKINPDGTRRVLKIPVNPGTFSDFMKTALPHARM
jgi:hypothetical protein